LKRMKDGQTLNVSLDSDEAKIESRQVDKEVTMRLQMSKQSRKTTLGNLQGDQSKVQLSKSPSFIVN
jgi:hypothetical protein